MKHILHGWLPIVLLSITFAGSCIILQGQIDTGAVLGTVHDSSGGVIPGATVTLTNEGTGFTQRTHTGPDGRYIFTPVKIGTYTVTAEYRGFERLVHPHVTVDIQQQVVVALTLVPGAVTQSVQVTAAPPLLQTQDASVGQVIHGRAINDLPLNGRNFTFLAQLAAGITPMQPSGGNPTTGSFAANGVQPGQNNYMIDGIDNNSAIIDDRQGNQYVILPPPDAISEFQVQTTDYSAAFGRGGGGVLNATLKSGTNEFHGDLWEFLRNDKLDATDFFTNAAGETKTPLRRNQFGLTAGGPVTIPGRHRGNHKTFFFASYQGTIIRQGTSFVETVPTLLERQSGYTDFSDLISGQLGSATRTDLLGRTFPSGTIFDPATTRSVTKGQIDPVTGLTATASGYVRDPFYTGGSLRGVKNFVNLCSGAGTCPLNQIPAGRLDPNAIKLLNLFPSPTAGGIEDNYTGAGSSSNNAHAVDVRIDRNFSSSDQMFVRYTFSQTRGHNPSPLPGYLDGLNSGAAFLTRPQDAALSETHIFSPHLINEFRGGFARLHQHGTQEFSNVMGIPSQFGIQGIPQTPDNGGLPHFSVGSLSAFGSPTFTPANEFSMLTQAEDNVTKNAGAHTLQTGFEFQHIHFPWNNPPYSRGSFTFNGQYTSVINNTDPTVAIAQFLLVPIPSTVPNGINYVGGANSIQVSNFQEHDYARNYFGAYLGDTWRVTNKLSVTLGLRWEHFDPIYERYGALANFVPGPPGQGAEYIIPANRAADVPQSFIAALAKDGIVFNPTNAYGKSMVTTPFSNFAPRLGLAYLLTPRFVMRIGYGVFYGFLQNLGGSPTLGNNFPFVYTLTYQSNGAQLPITPDGSIGKLENGLANIPLSPAALNPFGVSINGFQLNAHPSATQGYNFSLQYQLTAYSTLTVGYAGSVSSHLLSLTGANNVTELLPPSTNPQLYVPYPDFPRGSNYISTETNSNYNAMLVNIERRFNDGLFLLGNFTWSNCRTDANDPLRNSIGSSRYRAPGIWMFPIQQDYGQCDFNIRRTIHFSGGYELPFGQGKRFLSHSSKITNGVLGSWRIGWIVNLHDGFPFQIQCTQTTAAGAGCHALLVPGQNPYAGLHNVDQFLNPAAFANPPAATSIGQTDFAPLGGAPTQVNGPPFARLDLSLMKDFKISETSRLEVRGECFNLTNTPAFGLPSNRNFTQTQLFGRITSLIDGANDPRQIQLALKLYW